MLDRDKAIEILNKVNKANFVNENHEFIAEIRYDTVRKNAFFKSVINFEKHDNIIFAIDFKHIADVYIKDNEKGIIVVKEI